MAEVRAVWAAPSIDRHGVVPFWRVAVALAGLAGAWATGFALAWVAGRFGDAGPMVMVGLVVLPAAVLAVALDPRIGVGFVFFLFPVGFHEIPGTPLDLIQVLIVAVAGIALVCRLSDRAPLRLPAPLWWLVALVAWTLVSLPSALDSSKALRQVGALIVEMLFVLLILVACKSYDDVRRVMVPLVLVAAVVAATTTGSTELDATYGASHVAGRAQGVFTEPNQLGTVCMLATLLALALAFGSSRGRPRALAGGLATMASVGLVLSLSRGSWIGFAFGLAVLLGSLPEARRTLVVVGVVLLALGAVAKSFAASPPQVEVVGQRLKSIVGERNPYDNRPHIWAEARREVIERPILGFGPGNFPVASVRATSESRTTFARHAHNLLLTWAAESGIPAALLLVGLSVHLGLSVRRTRLLARASGRPDDAALVVGLGAAIAAVAGQGLIDYTLRNSVVFTAVVGVIGFLLVCFRYEASLHPDPRPV